MIKQRAAE
jgi:hypothetical protein